MNYISAVPAYGRDYKSHKEVREAWDRGLDFMLVGLGCSGYANKEDAPLGIINIRFNNLRSICVIDNTKNINKYQEGSR